VTHGFGPNGRPDVCSNQGFAFRGDERDHGSKWRGRRSVREAQLEDFGTPLVACRHDTGGRGAAVTLPATTDCDKRL